MALADLRHHSLESEVTLIEEFHPQPPSLDTMSIYMMSSSTDPIVSTITDDPSNLSLPLFSQPQPQPQLPGKHWGSFPINTILFLFLPSRIVSKSALETLNLQDFRLGDPVWYLEPPTVPLRPQDVLTHVQPIEMMLHLPPGPSNMSLHCFSNDEEILEALIAPEYPWDDMHHRSFFLPEELVS